MRVGDLLDALVSELGLFGHLRDEGPEGEDRAFNVEELIAGAKEFEAEVLDDWEEGELDNFSELDLYLQQVALVADIDRHDPEADSTTLMTLHNAKGLEFPNVFITGLEEGLFPLSRSYDDPETLEEERRLFYVGITRAQDKLYLVHAGQRRRAGDFTFGMLSSFVEAVPETVLERRTSERVRVTASFHGTKRRGASSAADSVRSGVSWAEEDMDLSMNQDLPHFTQGERVLHGTFGSGSIVDVSGFGRDLKVTVDFDDAGRKKLLARYAGLERDFD
jgi:DNA helicase-2/ATP-dependent DNA helicase PcrA